MTYIKGNKPWNTGKRDISKHEYNRDYFDKINTEEKAYWLGFIAADGCVSINRNCLVLKMGLGKKDGNHLEKFKRSIGSTHKIYKYKNGDFLNIYSKKITDDLAKYGIIPRKSLRFNNIPNIRKDIIRHFIRGYFDGDGCITHTYLRKNRAKGKKYSIYLEGSLSFLEKIQKILMKKCDLNKTKLINNGKFYTLIYGGNIQVPRILKYLYKDSKIYLDRKYKKSLQICQYQK